jgi:ankyrin repeat protein
VKAALDKGVHVAVRDARGNTALHYAAANGLAGRLVREMVEVK